MTLPEWVHDDVVLLSTHPGGHGAIDGPLVLEPDEGLIIGAASLLADSSRPVISGDP